MKPLYNLLVIVLLILTSLASCSKEGVVPKEEPVPPIELDYLKAEVGLSRDGFKARDTLNILKGSGNYKIIYPKYIQVAMTVGGTGPGIYTDVDFSYDFYVIHLEENKIIVELTHLVKEDHLMGYFMVIDDKNAKKVFFVREPDMQGGVGIINWSTWGEALANDDSKWNWDYDGSK